MTETPARPSPIAWRAWRYGVSRAYAGPWTKRHRTRDGSITLCGRVIPMPVERAGSAPYGHGTCGVCFAKVVRE